MNTLYAKYAQHLPIILNGVLFQVGWWVCILSSMTVALCFTLFYFMVHAFFLNKKQWLIALRILVVGLALDSFLSFSGVINLADDRQTLPVWLICIWAMFAVTPFLSMRFLNKHLALASVLGLVGGGLTYIAGDRLRDDIQLGDPTDPVWMGGIIMGLIWSVFLPLLYAYLRYQNIFPVKELVLSSEPAPTEPAPTELAEAVNKN